MKKALNIVLAVVLGIAAVACSSAEKMAEKAIKYKRSMALEPMNSYERHVIHTALQNYEGVTTSSTGVEPNRRVVVAYDREKK